MSMRRRFVIALLAIGALVGAVASCHAGKGAKAGATWEYRCANTIRGTDEGAHASMAILNKLGKEGWELVGVDPTNGHFCFKRSL